MLATLLSAGTTVAGGEVQSRAQLPLLLAQFLEPGLTTGTVYGGTVYGVDLENSFPTSTEAQLPLLLAQRASASATALLLGHISPTTVLWGVSLSGASQTDLLLGHIAANVSFGGMELPYGGFLSAGTDAPSVMVELDLTDPTLPNRTWTDITRYVRSVQITRGGRNHELQRSDVGTAMITLDNRDGRFDPGNATGPYYGWLKRMRWVRVRALYGTRVFDRCHMLVESIDQQWPAGGFDAVTTLRLADQMKILALYDLEGATFPEQTTGERAEAVLALAGISNSSIETGQSTVAAITEPLPEGSMALEHLRAVEETENGQLFADGDGTIVFHDRHHRILNSTSSATIGEDHGASEVPYREAQLSLDDAAIWNSVRITTASGTTVEVADTASISRYYERRLNRQLLSDDANEALNAAEYLLLLYADPPDRLPRINLLGQSDPDRWPEILALGNSDRVLWRRRPSTEDDPRTIEKTVIVERVAETIAPNQRWDVAIEVSPADVTEFWILGQPGRSELDQTTTLAY